jgi:hypothetical protein
MLGVMPLIYVVGLLSAYEQVFMRIDFATTTQRIGLGPSGRFSGSPTSAPRMWRG